MAFNSYMHERNIYRNQPDFTQIALDYPPFRKYAVPDATGKKVHVDFSNPDALRMVTEILLKKDFNLDVEIPEGFLIPTVPQRLNYILWLEDLLLGIPQEKEFRSGIDIGTGPCAIFSILGARKNNWNFIGTETSDDAIHWSKKNIEKNNLEDKIRVVKVSPGTTLSEVLSSNEESYDFCLCNPPFFGNIDEIRKKHHNSKETIADVTQKEEIFFTGGELNFVKNILQDSLIYKDRVCLFTSMFGKKKNFLQILKEIKELKVANVTTTEFCQGNTIRWGIAWTFNETIQFEKVDRRIKPKKAKPPLEYQIPLKNSKDFNLHILLQLAENFIKSLLIPVTVTKSSQYFAELILKSDKNTWTHQRRKRREMERQRKEANCSEKQLSGLLISKTSQSQVTETDSEIVSVQNVRASVDINESEITKDIGVTLADNSISIDTQELSEQCKINTETTKSNNKRKDFCLSDSSINKKIRLDLSKKNEDNLNSQEKFKNLSLKSSDSYSKEGCSLEANDKFTEMISLQKSSENCQTKESKALLEESLQMKQKNSLSLQRHNNELYSKKNEVFEGNKCGSMDEVCSTYKSNSSDDSKTASDSKIPENVQKEDNIVENLSEHVKSEFYSDKKVDSISSQQGSALHCHLHLIKGKNKIYVKMNCPPAADRSSMYQVFQLIKNKIK